MNKQLSDLAEQLAALGLRNAQSTGKRKSRAVTDFRPAGVIDTSDMETAMAEKLASASQAERPPIIPRPTGNGKAKSSASPITVEVRPRKTRRAAQQNSAASRATVVSTSANGQLTQAARERLHYEPRDKFGRDAIPDEKLGAGEAAVAPPSLCEGPDTDFFSSEEGSRQRFANFADAFRHITRLVGASAPEIEPRPDAVDLIEAERLDRRIASGARWLRDNPSPDDDNGYVVGFDFGTSALKIVVREAFLAGNDVAALRAPAELRSFGHPYLWQTVVWFHPATATFSLYPMPASVALEGFKTGLVGGSGSEAICTEPRVSRAEAATAFIALHLCHLFGWYEEERPLARTNATNFLSINIGVPVATHDDPVALQPFKEVIRAAVELAIECAPITLDSVRAAIEMVQSEDLPPGVTLVPELSAALVSYATDLTSAPGAHVLIDVGASTLDIVAFNLVDHDGLPEIKAFAASVELLGAAALEFVRAQGIDDGDFLNACNYQFGEKTYSVACHERVAMRMFSRKNNPNRPDVRLVVTGGGCETSVHSSMIGDLPDRILGAQTPARPEPPARIVEIECDRSRLLLAYGLAHDHPEIPHPTLPSGIPLIAPRAPQDGPQIVGPEQM